ncbi:hypothetical protein N0V93_004878 [Gnomoniopsis smithogilvyi]|uniref:Uncharacterized protein n=1 Tax=Gnomoniopsis smithogilvyi TaxID=1191159 RepID=A0A9W8YTE4_9PEZI|nr:hypothetical protein N0V93_004878 [Gnomoniopsis smithogilvyi]
MSVMTFENLVHRDLKNPTNVKVVWTVSTLAGGVFVLTAFLVAFRQFQRRRIHGNKFRLACLRDPSLTWDEYARKGRLTRSRLMFEEEVQRSVMIRKCQESRASDYKDTMAVEETLTRPPRSRSRTWHGDNRSMEWDEGDVEQGRVSRRETVAAWECAEATVDRTWLLLHRSKSPPGQDGLRWHEAAGLQRALSVRLETPPLLSHPLFREGNEQQTTQHMSLPTESGQPMTEPSSSQ